MRDFDEFIKTAGFREVAMGAKLNAKMAGMRLKMIPMQMRAKHYAKKYAKMQQNQNSSENNNQNIQNNNEVNQERKD